VGELLVPAGEDTPFHLDNGGVLGLKPFNQELSSHFGFYHVSTGEDIHGSIAILGPGMDREMGFSDDHHSADAKGIKLMEGYIYNGCPGLPGSSYHDILDGLQIGEDPPIAVP